MNSREKGKRGERRWRDVLRAAGFQKAHRGVQYSGGSDSPDVACPELPGIHFEVKAVEALNMKVRRNTAPVNLRKHVDEA